MKSKKIANILFFIGICIIIIGILLGTVLGFIMGEDGFNFVPSVTVWLLCIIGGTGFVTVSGTLNEAEEKKQDDEEFIKLLIENAKKDKKEED
jgi:ABC-type antimicrobial peptide transport system permease subunit